MVKGASSRGGAANDETSAAIAAQQRIFQLKKERDKKMSNVVAKAIGELNELERRISEKREERKRQRKRIKARMLREIARSVRERGAIEQDMRAVVAEMDAAMAEMERDAAEACDAQDREVRKMLEAGDG